MEGSIPSTNSHNTSHDIHRRIRQEYNDLIRSSLVPETNSTVPPFSLFELFENDGSNGPVIQLIDYCRQWNSHPDRAEIELKCLEFWKRSGLTFINNRAKYNDYIDCAMHMYTSGSADRVMTPANIIAFNYYLNDFIGRELYISLSLKEQEEARQLIHRLMDLTNSQLHTEGPVNPIENALRMLYDQLRANSPPSWFKEFINVFNHHLDVTHHDNTAPASCLMSALEDYRTARVITGGMLYCTAFVEYNNGCFFDWKAMEEEQLAVPVRRLQRVIAEFVGFINDLFSFEKEVIDNGHENDSNLIVIIALNYPTLSLRQVIYQAAAIIRDLLHEYFQLSTSIREQVMASNEEITQKNAVLMYLDGVADIIRAFWLWHLKSPRYKRKASIWLETNLPVAKVSS